MRSQRAIESAAVGDEARRAMCARRSPHPVESPLSRSLRWFGMVAVVACGLLGAAAVHAQCMLANPSLEVRGSGGTTFAGWNQFGPVALSTNALHGIYSARVTGPNSGTWNVSGIWQTMDCAPGRQFSASVWVLNSSAAPLAGGSQALLNIEWRDAADNLISYESHAAADAAGPTDTWRLFTTQSQPAPAGAASIHFVLGVLQGPTDPTPQVLFDEATCTSLGPPTLESLQWLDFPSGRALSFSGYSWRVKGPGYYGPGPNLFDNSASAAWVDASGQLNLTIHNIGGNWYSSEVVLDRPLGYGDYVFTTRGRLDTLDPNTVFGLFLWEYGPCYDEGFLWWNPYNEIDVEFSRWGSPTNANAQFVAQPASTGGNIHRFNVAFGDTELVSHAMRWQPHSVEYRSWRGGPDAESPASLIDAWTYTGANLPRPESPRVHLNLWQIAPPTSLQSAIVHAFTFRRICPNGNCGVLEAPPATAGDARLAPAAPNPFGGGTVIRFTLTRAGSIDLSVFDLGGRQVRRLATGPAVAGPHAVAWNGLDDSGRRATPGVYFYRLRADGRSEMQRVVMLR